MVLPVEPLRYRFRVECSQDEAFWLWTAGAGRWWPMATHSVSGRREARLVIEPGAGGRIYEQSPDGREFPWGYVMVWEPPARLVCHWLVGDTPTELEVRFAAERDGATVVEIEHRGWERFGDAGNNRRGRNDLGWSGVLPGFEKACKAGAGAG